MLALQSRRGRGKESVTAAVLTLISYSMPAYLRRDTGSAT
jgi:hypothetical protein